MHRFPEVRRRSDHAEPVPSGHPSEWNRAGSPLCVDSGAGEHRPATSGPRGYVRNEGSADMRAGSPMMRRLWNVDLSGADFRNTAARQSDLPDRHRSIHDLSPEQRLTVTRLLTGDAPEEVPRATWNLGRSLLADSRFGRLQRGLRRALEAGELSTTDAGHTRALVTIHDRVMPPVDASHTGILRDDATVSDDAVDRIVRELSSGDP